MEFLTLVRGIRTFLGAGKPCEAAYSCAAKSFAGVKRVPSTKRASQNGLGKSLNRCRPNCKIQSCTQNQEKREVGGGGGRRTQRLRHRLGLISK